MTDSNTNSDEESGGQSLGADARELVSPSGSARPSEPSPMPPLVLAPSDPPRLIYERAHEPTEASPIVYRERAFVVDSLLSDEELQAHLLAELGLVRDGLEQREEPQFVQLAAFDHSFEDEPSSPPLATLSWKGWHDHAEIWVRGVQQPLVPSELQPSLASASETPSLAAPESAPAPSASPFASLPSPQANEDLPDDDDWGRADDVLSAPPVSSVAQTAHGGDRPGGDRREGAASDGSDEQRAVTEAEAGVSWSAPHRSGQYPAVHFEEAPVPPPSSERVLASEELVGALFERMHELLYLPDIASGAEYVLETLSELIAIDAAVVHVFDLDAREFVVVRASGPRASELVSRRVPSSASYLEEVLRRQATQRFGADVMDAAGALWRDLGIAAGSVLCAPVHQQGRYLGAIELALEAGKPDFTSAHQNALEYACDQFADFVAARPFTLDPVPSEPS